MVAHVTLDPNADDLRPVAELVQKLTGRRPSPATVWRWCSRGTRRAGVLPSLSIYGQRHTTREALLDWLRRGSEVASSVDDIAAAERDATTERRLRSAGLL